MDKEENIRRAKNLMEKDKKKKIEVNKKMWDTLKEFKTHSDVPKLPLVLTDYIVNKLIECGAIPLNELKDQHIYYGDYRNSCFGIWNSKQKVFKIKRFKFGVYYFDDCNHFQQDDGYALFVPIREANYNEIIEEYL